MKPAGVLAESLWPGRTICLCCQRPAHGGYLCADCSGLLAALRITGPVCNICGHPLEEGHCTFCARTDLMIMRAVWTYRAEIRQLVHTLKFGGIEAAAQVMADAMADAARTLCLPPETVVTWPTMPSSRRLERGIDHGELLATAVANRLSLPAERLLIRSDRVATAPQARHSRAERLTRLQGAFSCALHLTRPVLLVDDVLTTSATATACANCLRSAGATSVMVITAAQTPLTRQAN